MVFKWTNERVRKLIDFIKASGKGSARDCVWEDVKAKLDASEGDGGPSVKVIRNKFNQLKNKHESYALVFNISPSGEPTDARQDKARWSQLLAENPTLKEWERKDFEFFFEMRDFLDSDVAKCAAPESSDDSANKTAQQSSQDEDKPDRCEGISAAFTQARDVLEATDSFPTDGAIATDSESLINAFNSPHAMDDCLSENDGREPEVFPEASPTADNFVKRNTGTDPDEPVQAEINTVRRSTARKRTNPGQTTSSARPTSLARKQTKRTPPSSGRRLQGVKSDDAPRIICSDATSADIVRRCVQEIESMQLDDVSFVRILNAVSVSPIAALTFMSLSKNGKERYARAVGKQH